MVYKMLRDEYNCCIDCGGKCSFRGRIRNEFECWYRYIFVCDKCGAMYEDCFGVEEDDDDED